MKAIITGLPYFSKYIQEKLKNHFENDHFVRLNTYYCFWEKLLYLVLLPFVDVVYSINGATHGSKVVDLAIRLKKRIVFHWVGSDVMLAKEAFTKNQIDPDYIREVKHITDTPWLVDELASIGITAQFIPLKACKVDLGSGSEMPDKFSILTYIPQNKEQFYGIDYIIHLAEKFPETEIRIAGMASYSKPLPGNITLLGWIENMSEEIQRNAICIRIPEHDGLSFFVLESLANQRYVIYNQKFDPCIYAYDDQSLQEKVGELILRFERSELPGNLEGSAYVLKNFNEAEIVQKIYNVLQG